MRLDPSTSPEFNLEAERKVPGTSPPGFPEPRDAKFLEPYKRTDSAVRLENLGKGPGFLEPTRKKFQEPVAGPTLESADPLGRRRLELHTFPLSHSHSIPG